jgi:hypothetical protein
MTELFASAVRRPYPGSSVKNEPPDPRCTAIIRTDPRRGRVGKMRPLSRQGHGSSCQPSGMHMARSPRCFRSNTVITIIHKSACHTALHGLSKINTFATGPRSRGAPSAFLPAMPSLRHLHDFTFMAHSGLDRHDM